MAEFWDGKIILVLPDDPKYATKKVCGGVFSIKESIVKPYVLFRFIYLFICCIFITEVTFRMF